MTEPKGRPADEVLSPVDVEIAIVDRDSVIISVNDAWERFGPDNGGDPELIGVGANYLEVCDRAGDDRHAIDLAVALRAALAGETANTTLARVPYHPPESASGEASAGERWFDVTVSSRTDEAGEVTGAVLTFVPLTGTHGPGQDGLLILDQADRSTAPPLGSPPLPLSDLPVGDAALAWAMVEATPDALLLVNEHGVIELVNGQAEAMFGHDRGELLGRPVEVLLPDRFAAVHRAHRTRYRATPEVRAMGTGTELLARRSDGEEFPVEVSLSPLRVGDDLTIIAIIRDITERRNAELREMGIRNAIDSVADGVFVIDPDDLRFLYVNHGACEQTGYDSHQLLDGMTPLHVAPEFTGAQLRRLLAPLIDGSTEALHFETVLRHRTGRDLPVEVVLGCPTTADGEQRAMVAVVRDVSERVAAQRHTRLIQASIDAVSDAVFVCDEVSLQFIHVNQGAVELHGYTKDELLSGMSPMDLAPGLPAETLADQLAGLAAAPANHVRFRTEGRRKDGEVVPVEVDLNWPDTGDAVRPVVAVARNISARVEAEKRLRASEAQFRTAFGDGPVPMTLTALSPTEDQVILEANQAMADLLGYPTEELVGMSFSDVTHPDDLEPDVEATARILAGNLDEFSAEKRYLRSDGDEVWVQLHVAVLERGDNRVTTIGHAVDITAEVGARVAAKRQETLARALSQVRLRMLQGADRTEGLELVCHWARRTLGASMALILTPDRDGGELEIEADDGLSPPARAGLRFRSDQGLVGEVFTTARPLITTADDERIPEVNRQIGHEHSAGSIVLAPLHAANAVAGILLVVREDDTMALDQQDLTALEQFASEAVVTIELAAAQEAEHALEVLEDRERIGRDMHDKVIGRLFATGMTVQATIGHLADRGAAQARLEDAVGEIDEAIKEIRTTIYGVRSQPSWGRGIRGEILAIAAEQYPILGFEPQVHLSGPIDGLPRTVVDELLPTLREALANVARYADATSVTVEVHVSDQRAALEVRDNGIGFDPAAVSASNDERELSGNGLRNIRYRASRLGGEARVESGPGRGTDIEWSVPLG